MPPDEERAPTKHEAHIFRRLAEMKMNCLDHELKLMNKISKITSKYIAEHIRCYKNTNNNNIQWINQPTYSSSD
jgi:hypothetical protein